MTPIELANLALHKIGVTQGVEALDDSTREAYSAGLVYDHRLRVALRRHPWAFATKYRASREGARHVLFLAAGRVWETDPDLLTTVAAWDVSFTYEIGDVVRNDDINYVCIATNTGEEPPDAAFWSTDSTDGPLNCGNGDWLYAYRWPDDCIKLRRIVPFGENGRQFNPSPIEFRRGRDVNGLLIYTNQQEAELEYTTIDCDNFWTDDLFLDAFTWLLAGDLAPGLSRNGLTQADCYAKFEYTLQIAATSDMTEQQQHPDGDPEWIRNR